MRTVLVLACLLFPASAEAGKLTVFDMPGAATTCGTAIASNGLVAGQATAGGIGSAIPFLWRDGHFSTPKPNLPAGLIYLAGINAAHTLVGTDLTHNLKIVAFIAHGGTVNTPKLRGHPIVNLDGITDTGTVLGQVDLPVVFPNKIFHAPAFLKDGYGRVTLLDNEGGDTTPAGMDGSASTVVGRSITSQDKPSWVYRAGRFAPVIVPGALLTSPQGVDASGQVEGYYYAGTAAAPVVHGFTFANNAYATWDIPGAADTWILAVNDRGQKTGCFRDAAGAHGYLFTP